MEELQNQYRIQVTISRKGEPVFISAEYKTENFEQDLDTLLDELDHFVEQVIWQDDEEVSSESL